MCETCDSKTTRLRELANQFVHIAEQCDGHHVARLENAVADLCTAATMLCDCAHDIVWDNGEENRAPVADDLFPDGRLKRRTLTA